MSFAAFSRGWEKDVVLLLVPYWEHSLFKAERCHPRWGLFSWRRTSVAMSPKQSKSRWPTWCSQSENDFWDELKFWGVAAVTSLYSESSARSLSLFSSCCFCDHLIYCMHSGAWKGAMTLWFTVGFPNTMHWWWLWLLMDTEAFECIQGHIVVTLLKHTGLKICEVLSGVIG